uniref:Putative golgin IMH1 n=1 Tax=Triatoma infestans TaxID=30076 RepID=A0A170WFW6_TRIIF
MQPLEWFNPSIPQPHPAYSVPMYSTKKEKEFYRLPRTAGGQSSETTSPPRQPSGAG